MYTHTHAHTHINTIHTFSSVLSAQHIFTNFTSTVVDNGTVLAASALWV